MKDQKNRLKVNRVFVLGAGASYSASLSRGKATNSTSPLDKDFCRRIQDLDRQRPAWISTVRDTVGKNWRDHVPFADFGLEAALIRHLSHLDFFEAIDRRRAGKNALTAAEYVDQMAHLITFVLRCCKENSYEVYRRLAGIVYPPNRQLDATGADRIITFNYDDLLDGHLLRRFTPQRLYFDRLKDSPGDTDRRSTRSRYPLLVKLHGSVNWRCSTDEFKKLVGNLDQDDAPHEIPSIWFAEKGSPSPSDAESPCIVPPMPNKPVTQIRLFRYLWSVACEYLHEAEEIVVCGYSLPETDALAMSLFGQLRNTKLKRVVVVDPNPAILDRWRRLLVKDKRSVRWEYHADFSEFVDVLEG